MSEFSSPAKEFPRLFGPFAAVEAKLETASPYKRIPPLMAPEKFVSGKDSKSQASDTTLCSQAAAIIPGRCVLGFDLPDDVDTLLLTLRRKLAGPKTALEYREEFYMRQQRPEESLMDYMGSVRRLARLAYPMYTVKDAHVLDRFLAGLREPRAKDELQLRPSKDLAAAESIAEILDRNGHCERRSQGAFAAGFRGEWRAPPGENGERKHPMSPACYTCRQLGHTSRFCRDQGGPSKSILNVANANNFTNMNMDVRLPFVEVKVEKKAVNCLLDSGSGPDWTIPLIDVLNRFRLGAVAVAADIQDMFLQIKMPEDQRDALRLLWWPDDDLQNPAVD
ncbi:unnamed protein product [Echinostoma caproni]|uniref:CCHC-type domain-containing protein n=1 Tax=Echinostoma caproni TaxID=27848 RepID=A0A183AXU8_9TREM|nr:unnamed protein product [Echinostoma caproni]